MQRRVFGSTPPLFATALGAVGDAVAAIRAMPGRSGVALLALAALEGGAALLETGSAGGGGGPALGLAATLVQSFLEYLVIAWLGVAVMRFVVLRTVPPGLGLVLPAPAFGRFYLGVALLLFPNDLIAYATALPALGDVGFRSVFFLAALVLLVVQSRSMLVLPALAAEAPGASWANAIADSAGHAWRCVLVLLVNTLATAAVAGVVAGVGYGVLTLLGGALGDGVQTVSDIALGIGAGALLMLGTATMTAAIARLYLFYADALTGRPEL